MRNVLVVFGLALSLPACAQPDDPGTSGDGRPISQARPIPTGVRAGTWAIAGQMNVARAHHRTVAISPTEVLAVGGSITGDVFSGATASAEIFDLETMAWRETASVGAGGVDYPTQLSWVTVLRDGEVLVAGGFDFDGNMLTGSYIFNPRTETWRKTANELPVPSGTENKGVDPLILKDGRVLIAGGAGYLPPDGDRLRMSDASMIYDPRTDRWSLTHDRQGTTTMVHGREKARMVLLRDGRALVIGGFEYVNLDTGGFEPLTSFEIWDPATGDWTDYSGARQVMPVIPYEEGDAVFANLPIYYGDPPVGTSGDHSLGARYSAGAQPLWDGRVMVYGGSEDLVDDNGGFTASVDRRSVLIFNPARLDDPWTAPTSERDPLNMARGRQDFQTGTWQLQPYAFGGFSFAAQNDLDASETYSPLLRRWVAIRPEPGAPGQPGIPLVDTFGQQLVQLRDTFILSGSVWDYDLQSGPSARTLVYRAR